MIETKALGKTYGRGNTKVTALKNVNLTVEDGGFVAIMGPSGSGKSTLLNILGCLDTPTSGRCFLNGIDTSSLSSDGKAALRRNTIGFVFQSFNLLPKLSAYANVELPLIYGGICANERIKRVDEALSIVKMSNRSHHLPSEMSGGQRQRTAIARALIMNPKLILADEPTGNLDQKTGETIMEILNKLNDDGRTVVLITHDAAVANHAKRTYYICDGILNEQ